LQHRLAQLWQQQPTATGCCVALSGGLDSTLLLQLLARQPPPLPLRAIHIHHALQSAADNWAQWCQQFADRLQIPLTIIRVQVDRHHPGGLEAAARQARYQALRSALQAGELLLTGHHRNDQAETLLLQLLRGSGSAGLAAMPPSRRLGRGWLLRPLLPFDRAQLQRSAEALGIDWIEDPSNQDIRFDRNLLRQRLLPLLTERRPGAVATLARSSEQLAEDAALLQSLAAIDLAQVVAADGQRDQNDTIPPSLPLLPLQQLTPARTRNLLRYWLRQRALPLPSATTLAALEQQLLPAAADAEPVVRWPGAELRRYRHRLYAFTPLPPPPPAGWQQPITLTDAPLQRALLPPGCGVLLLRRAGNGLLLPLNGAISVQIGISGSYRCRRHPAAPSQQLRRLWQQFGIPPWLRQRWPLLMVDDALCWIPGIGACYHHHAATAEGERWSIRWLPATPLIDAGGGVLPAGAASWCALEQLTAVRPSRCR